VEAVGSLQVVDDVIHSLETLLSCDESPFDADEHGHHSKAGAACSNDIEIVRHFALEMVPLSGHT
jgi:hypothetical protein